MCGLLGKSMYGNRDAAQNRGQSYVTFMVDVGFFKGITSQCCFYHNETNIKCVVHGDDFSLLGSRKELARLIQRKNQGEVPVKFRGRLGPGDSDDKEFRILNGIITWIEKCILYE